MIIDTHQHYWNYNEKEFGWISDEMDSLRRDFLPKDIADSMKRQRVTNSVAVQARQSEEETRFLLHLADENPFIAGVVGWIDLRADNIEERLAQFAGYEKIKGFRHIVEAEPDNQFLMRADVQRGIRALGVSNMTYDILIKPSQLDAALQLVEKHNDQKFVIDHLAKPDIKNGAIKNWSEKMQRFADMEHVYCKISGMVTEADWQHWHPTDFYPYMDVIIDTFGVDRILLGSDWPVCTLAASYQEVWDIVLTYLSEYSKKEVHKICYSNAVNFYQLDVSNRL